MKRVRIRHRGDPQLFVGDAGWSLNEQAAKTFNAPLEAIAFILQRQISNAELIAETPAEQREVAVSV